MPAKLIDLFWSFRSPLSCLAVPGATNHWGVPTFVFEGEPFFGEDRIDILRWHLGNTGFGN